MYRYHSNVLFTRMFRPRSKICAQIDALNIAFFVLRWLIARRHFVLIWFALATAIFVAAQFKKVTSGGKNILTKPNINHLR